MRHLAHRQAVHGVTHGADDLALQPVQAHEFDVLELFTETVAAQLVVEKIKKIQKFRRRCQSHNASI